MNPYRLLGSSSALLLAVALAGSASGLAASAASSAARVSGQSSPAAAAAPAGQSGAASSGSPASPAAVRRVEIPGPDGKPLPYSVELPAGWQVITAKDVPGVFLGPASVTAPETDPRVIYVRVSPASLANPAAVVANIKLSEAADKTWSAPIVEVREVGGVRGVLVRMDSGAGDQARSTLVLKMPLGQTSLDFMASAQRGEFERQLPGYQRVIFSVLPAR